MLLISSLSNTLTKGVLIKCLEGVPDDTNIALEIHEFGQLEFIVTSPDGQDRILRVGVLGGEQIDPETNEQEHLIFTPRRSGGEETGKPIPDRPFWF